MAGIIAKHFGWSYSRTLHVIAKKRIESYIIKSGGIAFYSTQSQFVGKRRKQEVQKQKKRYLNRIESLDPDHDLDMPGN